MNARALATSFTIALAAALATAVVVAALVSRWFA